MNDESDAACPECGAALAASDPRFSTWCPACDWNVDPAGGDPLPKGALERRRTEPARRERMFDRISSSGDAAAVSRDAAWYGAMALATGVNLLTLVLAGFGVWLLVAGTVPERLLGAFALLIAVVLRPRPGRPPRHTLRRDAAPTLYAVADRIATGLGVAPVDVIAVDARYGSSYARVGARRTTVVVVGLPLWECLGEEQRLALLAHELCRGAGGDGGRGPWPDTALATLSTWTNLLGPGERRRADNDFMETVSHGGLARGASEVAMANARRRMADSLAKTVLAPFAISARLLHRLLSRLTDQTAARSQYLADKAAARIASPGAVEGLLRALLLRENAVLALDRLFRGSREPWPEWRTYMASVPDAERARRLRLSELRGDAFGGGCPPTHLRIDFVRKLPHTDAAVRTTPDEATAIDAELEPVRAAVAEELRR